MKKEPTVEKKYRLVCQVIPAKKTNVSHKTYSYLVPEIYKTISAGTVVEIPFGKEKELGIIEKVQEEEIPAKESYSLKEILGIQKDYFFPDKYIEIIKWIASYYLCSLGEAGSLFLPPKVSRPVKPKEETIPALLESKKLTKEQNDCYKKITDTKKPVLLHGVTGSGKTEIYIKLIESALKENKKVIFLVPEIMLATQTIEKLKERFSAKIALYHSNLSKSEKYNSYIAFQSGQKPIILGPRSALTIPAEKIGLIIIDEEHEDSYKQESNPRYHALLLAKRIADISEARLVLGSATPRIEDYYRTKLGQFELVKLTARYNQLILPPSIVIDLKNEIKEGNFSSISRSLHENIERCLAEKKQIILFLNRLGMATFVSCRDCGMVIKCPNCDIPLVYHINDQGSALTCHHCGHHQMPPQTCPDCKGARIKYFGAGIDRIEREIKMLFPKARVAKVNSKTMENKDAYADFYKDIKAGKIDIILGTQIVAKGLDLPNVDMVGVISADTGLHMPQYQASEKVFQLLTQVSGRSGRKHSSGLTVIQSYWPDMNPIVLASKHDFEKFYDSEILERKKFDYPPFKRLIRVISEDNNQSRALQKLKPVALELSEAGLDFIGPGPCFFSKINGRFRYHVLIKTAKIPDKNISSIFEKNQYLTWDVEPTNLL